MSRLHYEEPNPYDLSPTPGMESCEQCLREYLPRDMFTYGPRKLCHNCVPRCGSTFAGGIACDEPAHFGSEGGFCLDGELDATKDLAELEMEVSK